jgi:hypothetical protein
MGQFCVEHEKSEVFEEIIARDHAPSDDLDEIVASLDTDLAPPTAPAGQDERRGSSDSRPQTAVRSSVTAN